MFAPPRANSDNSKKVNDDAFARTDRQDYYVISIKI